MYFIFSKVLLFLILPINWIVFALLVALIAKRPGLKKRSLITALVLLIVFSNHYLLCQFARWYDLPAGALNDKKVYSAAILLGGFTAEGKSGKGFFNEYGDRFIQGLKLQTTGKVSHVFISGGNGNLGPNSFKESDWVKDQLKEFKLPDSVVLNEDRSRNTIENAIFTKQILVKAHLPPPYLLVTSPWHMRRAAYIFKKEGLDIIPYPSNRSFGDSKIYLLDIFSIDPGTLNYWSFYMKEVVGLAVTHIKYAL